MKEQREFYDEVERIQAKNKEDEQVPDDDDQEPPEEEQVIEDSLAVTVSPNNRKRALPMTQPATGTKRQRIDSLCSRKTGEKKASAQKTEGEKKTKKT